MIHFEIQTTHGMRVVQHDSDYATVVAAEDLLRQNQADLKSITIRGDTTLALSQRIMAYIDDVLEEMRVDKGIARTPFDLDIYDLAKYPRRAP